MGARKLKWTEEEETALKAGVDKYGTGKWRTILKDPDFGGILKARSNVDLKDKWRNMNAIVNHPNNNNARGVSREQRVSRKNTVKKPSKSSSSSSLDSPTLALPGPVAEPIRPNNANVNGNAANDIENQQGQWQVGTSNGGQECNVQLANGGVSDFASANYEEVVMDCLRVSQGSMDVNGIFEILRNQYDFPVYYKELVPATLDGLVSKGLVEKSEDCRYSLKLASSDCPMDELYFGWEWDQFEVPPSPDQGGLDIPEIELGLEEQAKLESELFLDGQQQPIADDPVSYSSLFDQFLATGIVTI